MVLDTFDTMDNNSEGGEEIPMMDEAEEKLVSQDQSNSSSGMRLCTVHTVCTKLSATLLPYPSNHGHM